MRSLESIIAKYDLSSDLVRMITVFQTGADEATVFYASRILEALSGTALIGFGLMPSENLYSDLGTLQQYDLIPPVTRCWAHSLRRLGNDARHIRRRIRSREADTAVALVGRCLEWGDTSARELTVDSNWKYHLDKAKISDSIIRTIARCEQVNSSAEMFADAKHLEAICLIDPSGSVAAALVEMLLDLGNLSIARSALEYFLRHCNSARLQQLQVLELSRSNDPNAILLGEHLLGELCNDEESLGIVAGAYKRQWVRNNDFASLIKAHQLYAKGWKESRGTNFYLGINASATEIFLGNAAALPIIAAEIFTRLTERLKRLESMSGKHGIQLNLWDVLTLAEATLQLRRYELANQYYQAARHRATQGQANVAFQQARQILLQYGWSESAISEYLTE